MAISDGGGSAEGESSPARHFLKLEDLPNLLSVGTAAAVVLYAALFLAYRNYYSSLHVDPEEVGVTYAYILVRSLGLIIPIFAGACFANFAVAQLYKLYRIGATADVEDPDGWRPKLAPWLTMLAIVGIWGVIGWFYSNLYPSAPLTVALTVFAILILAIIGGIVLKARGYHLARHVFILAIMVGLPAVLIILAAGKLGEEVMGGYQVDSEETFAVPILDVEAPLATVTWIGPPAQKPSTIFTDSQNPFSRVGILIGQSPTSLLVILVEPDAGNPLRKRLVRLPIASTSVEVPLFVTVDPPIFPTTEH